MSGETTTIPWYTRWANFFKSYDGPPQKVSKIKQEPIPEEIKDRTSSHIFSMIVAILLATTVGLVTYILKKDTKNSAGRDGPGFFDPDNPWKPGDGPIGWEPPDDWPPTWPFPGNPPPNWPWPDNAQLAEGFEGTEFAGSFELSGEQVHQLQLLSDYSCDSDFGVMEGSEGTFHNWGTEEWVIAGAALFLLARAFYKFTEWWMKSPASNAPATTAYGGNGLQPADMSGPPGADYVPGTSAPGMRG